MFYLGIDQHRKQLTVNLRNELGDVVLRRQVSTRWQAVREFFAGLHEQSQAEGGYVAILEVCGFNHWLLTMLQQSGCRKTLVVQLEQRSKHKTDRRDANRLCEMLWLNRARLLAGKKVQQLRVVQPASPADEQARQLTALWRRVSQQRTRTLNGIQHLLLKHNLQQECPTKGLQTQRARNWLKTLALPAVDRLEMNYLLAQWALWDHQRQELDEQIQAAQRAHPLAPLVATLPGAGAFSSLGLACRVGDIRRFPRPQSLANYWGLAPGCRNSGDATARIGSITKQGSPLARFILGQLVLHVLRRDGKLRRWYTQVKRRRGAKIARVAVMRRLTTVLWHMLKHDTPYRLSEFPQGRRVADQAPAYTRESIAEMLRPTSARSRPKGAAPSTFLVTPAPG